MTKSKQTKKAGSSRKTPKADAASVRKSQKPIERDPRLPAAGTTIVRPFKGKEVLVVVLEDGFEYKGAKYRSLTGIARIVTGYPAISGPAFFRLTGTAPAAPKVESAERPTKKARTPKVRRAARDPQAEGAVISPTREATTA